MLLGATSNVASLGDFVLVVAVQQRQFAHELIDVETFDPSIGKREIDETARKPQITGGFYRGTRKRNNIRVGDNECDFS